MTVSAKANNRLEALENLRLSLIELLGAERRLRGREHQRDLTYSQFRALTVLAEKPEVTAGELAKSADLNPASVTAMLDQLESNGILERRRDTSDRRVCMVSLTERGRGMLDEKRAQWQTQWLEHVGELSEEELSGAIKAMRSIARMWDDM